MYISKSFSVITSNKLYHVILCHDVSLPWHPYADQLSYKYALICSYVCGYIQQIGHPHN